MITQIVFWMVFIVLIVWGLLRTCVTVICLHHNDYVKMSKGWLRFVFYRITYKEQ